jgi:hypothetical protein
MPPMGSDGERLKATTGRLTAQAGCRMAGGSTRRPLDPGA